MGDSEEDKGEVEYWNYEYSGGTLHYKTDVLCANVEGDEAYFMFQIPDGWPISGLYVVSWVKDGGTPGTNGDEYGHTATSNKETAYGWCEEGSASVTTYDIVDGNLVVHYSDGEGENGGSNGPVVLSSSNKDNMCTTIPSGNIEDSQGNTIYPGFNSYGYNYQAHLTNQGIEEYCQQRNDIPEGKPGHWDYGDCIAYFEKAPFELVMKWNDAWLSNKDCDEDGLLDRHYGYETYIGSGAWLTNHQRGEYENGAPGNMCHWTYFVKIVAKPTEDYNCEDNGGQEIWGSFCIIESVYNDICADYAGLEFKSQHPGFGYYKP